MTFQENLKVIALTKVELEKAYATKDALSLKQNSTLSELLAELSGVPNVTAEIGSEGTRINIHYGQSNQTDKWRTHEFSIYHRRKYIDGKYTKEQIFDLNWFSTTAELDGSENGLVDYLKVLALCAESINKNGAVKRFISSSVERFKPHSKEINELSTIIQNHKSANESLVNNAKAYDVDQAVNNISQPIVLVPELNELQDAKKYYIGKRDTVWFTEVRVVKQTKKMTHFELRTVHNSYKRDAEGNYIMTEDGHYTYELTNEYSGLIQKLRHNDFSAFIFRNWPKAIESYQAEVEAVIAA
jgi:hypothetical protein